MLSFDKCVQNGLVLLCIFAVTPCAGVWIEIGAGRKIPCAHGSLPVRECGLKFFGCNKSVSNHAVTPCAGVWIEIEIRSINRDSIGASLPVRECGLKSTVSIFCMPESPVTPCAGVWIEIVFEVATSTPI